MKTTEGKTHYMLEDGVGHYITEWRNPIPDWQATYLSTLPNENAMFTYKLIVNGTTRYEIAPGRLMLEINRLLMAKGLPL